ncbi:hypothetical protein DLJ53_25885 [Acuticoccus sediminis]|uniref:DUF1849 family protein n=1 Tax=Acuticoccus sediminis TaxID=2184697 RepID=A0A8B2NRZ8_9HYPH|nr:DUF1849 family protein [Acuticoccus sediminis]RAH98152.1 hypothetical protein DLJ53_25885 [Acuticoccus sediminis]
MSSLAGRAGPRRVFGPAGHAVRIATAALASLLAASAAASAPQPALVPHRAVYDLSLARVEPSVSILSVNGTLVYELEGSPCDGYTVTSTFQTNTVDREGQMSRTDLRTSTYETVGPAEFHFLNQTFAQDDGKTLVDGTATGTATGTMVEINKPKPASFELSRAVFPTQHTRLVLMAAANGERVLEAPMFDGGGAADTVYDTTTVIGPAVTNLPGATDREREAFGALADATNRPTYTTSISYFDQAADSGETVPDYVISFRMMDNGISYAATFDYGNFVLNGRLIDLEVMPQPQCPATAGGSESDGTK